MPLEQLLLETDAPDQPDAGPRPAQRTGTVGNHCQARAALRGMELEALAQATTENARRLFALPAT